MIKMINLQKVYLNVENMIIYFNMLMKKYIKQIVLNYVHLNIKIIKSKMKKRIYIIYKLHLIIYFKYKYKNKLYKNFI